MIQQRLGGYDLSRRADTALKTAVFEKCLLDGMELPVFGQPFDSGDFFTLAGDGKGQTGAHQPSIHDDAASAADADAAAFFGAGQSHLFTQGVEQQLVGLYVDFVIFSVNFEDDVLFHEFGEYLLTFDVSTAVCCYRAVAERLRFHSRLR